MECDGEELRRYTQIGLYLLDMVSGAGTNVQQGGQDQPFPAGGRCKAPAGSGAEPRRQADFDNNLLKIN